MTPIETILWQQVLALRTIQEELGGGQIKMISLTSRMIQHNIKVLVQVKVEFWS